MHTSKEICNITVYFQCLISSPLSSHIGGVKWNVKSSNGLETIIVYTQLDSWSPAQ